jgi:hypothetical protein
MRPANVISMASAQFIARRIRLSVVGMVYNALTDGARVDNMPLKHAEHHQCHGGQILAPAVGH